jgi:hypothetical protein
MAYLQRVLQTCRHPAGATAEPGGRALSPSPAAPAAIERVTEIETPGVSPPGPSSRPGGDDDVQRLVGRRDHATGERPDIATRPPRHPPPITSPRERAAASDVTASETGQAADPRATDERTPFMSLAQGPPVVEPLGSITEVDIPASAPKREAPPQRALPSDKKATPSGDTGTGDPLRQAPRPTKEPTGAFTTDGPGPFTVEIPAPVERAAPCPPEPVKRALDQVRRWVSRPPRPSGEPAPDSSEGNPADAPGRPEKAESRDTWSQGVRTSAAPPVEAPAASAAGVPVGGAVARQEIVELSIGSVYVTVEGSAPEPTLARPIPPGPCGEQPERGQHLRLLRHYFRD